MTRRTFLSLSSATAAAGLFPYPGRAALGEPKRIAVVSTIWRYLSHAQHIGDRFLIGYPYEGEWRHPNMKVVSLYVDQHPEGDQSQARAEEFGFKVYPTIAETLRCGGDKLACDAVLIIAEHGEYPSNDLAARGRSRTLEQEWINLFYGDGTT